MAHVVVDPDAMAAVSRQVGGVGAQSPGVVGSIAPAAADPVSVAAANTLSARATLIATYSAAASEVAAMRAAQLAASATGYADQEAANQAGLGLGTATPALLRVASAPIAPPVAPVVVPPPVYGPPPEDALSISTLIHAGARAPLDPAAADLTRQSSRLSNAADDLRSNATWLERQWSSAAGDAAAARLRELGVWYDGHAEAARSAAAATRAAADNFKTAQTVIPTPEALKTATQQLTNAEAAAAANPRWAPYYRTSVIPALRAQLADLQSQAINGLHNYGAANLSFDLTGEPPQHPPRPHRGIQAVDRHGGFPLDPTTTTSPTPEPPQCKPEDQAKLIKRFAEWCSKRDELTRDITAWDRKYPPGHVFDMRDPVQAAEYERGEELKRARGKLIHDFGELLKDATTCGAKQDEARPVTFSGQTGPEPHCVRRTESGHIGNQGRR
ncbi:PE family protein [Mycobacterium sp.]|uniref:PE family protein n=1 Tax=Mycobacterium sp. TaxID=1785 RepID=UPI002B9A3F76|nr:PE family protein [Mycobacterium sp.]HTQ17030.1 PE family protein [Mycobacterium sp.]